MYYFVLLNVKNEVNGPTQQAIDWINQVRERAKLADLKLADFPTANKLFEQIANVERPRSLAVSSVVASTSCAGVSSIVPIVYSS